VRILMVGLNPSDDGTAIKTIAASLKLAGSLFVQVPWQTVTKNIVQQQYLNPVASTDTSYCPNTALYPVVLVDYTGRLRGAYRNARGAEIKRLEEDVRSLRYERRYPDRVLQGRKETRLNDAPKR
jgi:hypothetical protein